MTIDATKLVGRVVGMPPPNGDEINKIDLVAGRLPDPARGDEVVVERHTAETFGLAAGNRVQVFDGTAWHEVTISGVAHPPEYPAGAEPQTYSATPMGSPCLRPSRSPGRCRPARRPTRC